MMESVQPHSDQEGAETAGIGPLQMGMNLNLACVRNKVSASD